MKKIFINDLEVRFNPDTIDEDYLYRVLSNNYCFFSMCMNGCHIISLCDEDVDNDEVVYVSNFDEKFKELVDGVYNVSVFPDLQNESGVNSIYLSFLASSIPDDNEKIFNFPTLDPEIMTSLMGMLYFDEIGDRDAFINFLKFRENKDMIIKEFSKKTRFSAYNDLLGMMVDFLKNNDKDVINQIFNLVPLLFRQYARNLVDVNFSNNGDYEFPKISHDELFTLFEDFLDSYHLDDWKIEFRKLRERNGIIFDDGDNLYDCSKCFYDDEDGRFKILLDDKDNLEVFCSLVHEFAHYMFLDRNTVSFLGLSEFPSIFFEKLSSLYLKKCGFVSEMIDNLLLYRNKNNIDIYLSIFPLFLDMSAYVGKGAVSRDAKIKYAVDEFNTLTNARLKLAEEYRNSGVDVPDEYFEIPEVDFEEAIDLDCDELLRLFLSEGFTFINGYQYLIGSFLADCVFEKLDNTSNDNEVVSSMKNIAENLGNYSFNDIVVLYNLNLDSASPLLPGKNMKKTASN